MSTLDISSASFILLPQMLFANGFSLKLSLLNCTLDKENDTFGASKAKNTMCSKLENNQEKSVIDKSLSGIFINNRSSLMSYEDYQNILDRITLRLDNIVQEASTRVRIIPNFNINLNLILNISNYDCISYRLLSTYRMERKVAMPKKELKLILRATINGRNDGSNQLRRED